MPEYIEREALRKSLLIGAAYLDEDTMMTVVNVLDCFPTADVAPVRHERCEYCKDGKSFSGQRLIFGNDGRWHTIQFCPVCGCKMDGGEQDA